jgi:hypothetical protein
MSDDWRDAWRDALDELELTLEQTERLLAGEVPGPIPGWAPPSLEGALPAEYAVRARLLLGRQQALVSETLAARVDVRRKIELLDKLTGSRRAAHDERPVYVDMTA